MARCVEFFVIGQTYIVSFHYHHWGRAGIWLVLGGRYDSSFTHDCGCDRKKGWDQKVGLILAAR